MRRSYVVPMRCMVIYEYEVPGGALNLSSTNLRRPWSPRSPWESSLSRKNPHGRTGNRTRDLMTSSQKLWPLHHEAGLCRVVKASKIKDKHNEKVFSPNKSCLSFVPIHDNYCKTSKFCLRIWWWLASLNDEKFKTRLWRGLWFARRGVKIYIMSLFRLISGYQRFGSICCFHLRRVRSSRYRPTCIWWTCITRRGKVLSRLYGLFV
jgi:hypothetical protein